MKKFILAALAVFLFWTQLPTFAAARLSGAKDTLFTTGSDLTNASADIVAAASGKTLSLFRLNFIIDAADTVTLKCGSTVKGTWEFTAAGGLDQNIYPLYIQCAVGESLNLNKGTAANDIYWQAWYELER